MKKQALTLKAADSTTQPFKTLEMPKDVASAIALLEKHGYLITPPVAPELPEPPTPFDWAEHVAECRETLERAKRREEDADERCMGTPLNDPDPYLESYRRESVIAGDRVAQAEEDLKRALKDQKYLG